MAFSIRAERPADAPAIRHLISQAYADVSYSDHREHLMVERLRASTAYIPGLSLLAEIEGQAVGHVMLTRVSVVEGESSTDGLALAPLSVVPAFQSRGLGSELVREAHKRAAGLLYRFIILVGLPGYYPRFGYEPLDDHPVTLPFYAPPSNRMIFFLSRDASISSLRGKVEYAPEWLDH